MSIPFSQPTPLTRTESLLPPRLCSVGMTKDVPFLLETELVAQGGKFEKAPEPWASWVVVDGNLYTGQNPASAGPLAERIKKDYLA